MLFQLFWCQTFGLQKTITFWKLSVSYHEYKGLLSLTVTETKEEFLLYVIFFRLARVRKGSCGLESKEIPV